MSAIDELCRMLDERGVEYRWDNGTATWYVDGVMYNAWGYDNERLTMSVCHLTPEQAIAATLGRGTCRDVYPNATYCFTCSECGHVRFIQGWNNVTDSSQDEFNFCPNCGRKVVAK